MPRAGDVLRDPALADALERLGAEGARAVLRRRHRRGDLRARVRARRHADARGPGRLRGAYRASRCGSATAAATCSPTRRRARAARCSPTRWRCSSASPARPTRWRWSAAMERAQDERTPELPHRPRRARLPRALHGQPARLDHAHLGARRRRLGVLGHVHERRGLGHRRARHRRARQQHDGRAGPLAARLLHAPAGAPAAVDDGSDRRARHATARPRSRSARRARTGSARRCCR